MDIVEDTGLLVDRQWSIPLNPCDNYSIDVMHSLYRSYVYYVFDCFDDNFDSVW